MSPLFLLFAAVLACSWDPAGCYSNGKVTKACSSMKPSHHGSGKTGPSPYTLKVNSTRFSPGDQIQVVLTAQSSAFEGFLLQARDPANQGSATTVGTFSLTDPGHTQLLTCSKIQGSAVSHTSAVEKTQVVVTWTAPADAPGQVQFIVSVVQSFLVFWVKESGPIIYQPGVTPLPPQPETTPPPVPTDTPSVLPGPFSSEVCGRSKSCLLDPPGCDPQSDPSCFFLSMKAEPNSTTVTFELSGPSDGYVAFALSHDTWMGTDDAYLCTKEESRVSLSAAFLSGRTYPEDQTESGLSSASWRLADGTIQCQFSRPIKMSDQDHPRYDLDQDYFLFIANGGAHKGRIFKHSRQPLISTRRILITGQPQVLRGSRGPILMKAHGALMMLAWILTGSVGTFIASFYKPDWPNRSIFGQKVWFQVHRGLMMLTVALTSAAFCLPFFYKKHLRMESGVHQILGCCVLALSLFQPIMAAFRPPPDSERRFIFSWAHFSCGSAAEVLAVITMFFGMHQSSLLLPQPLSTDVLIGYAVWLVFFRSLLLLQKHGCCKRSLPADMQAILSDQSESSQQGSFLRPCLLAVFALGNVAFLGTMLFFVAQL